MPAIQPFDDKLNSFNFGGHRFQLPKSVILPRRDELPKSYTPLVELLRLLPEYCTELSSVLLVATTQVKAHIMEATGGAMGLKRVQDLYSEADDGDGGRVLLARLFNDLVFAGWWICGNLYDGAVVTDLYHIDAAYTRFVINDEVTNFGTFTRKQAPLMYHRGRWLNADRIPILRDTEGSFTEAWWDIAWPRTKEQIRDSGGWHPGNIPILGAYDMIRALGLARAVQHAKMSGEKITKLVFVPQGLATQTNQAKAGAEADRDPEDINHVSEAMLIEVNEKPDIAEVNVLSGMTADELDLTSKRAIILMSALIGVNPMDVDPSTSGAGGLNEGTKAKVADDLREGRLVAQFINAFTSGFNKWTAPRTAEIGFTYKDPRDESRRIANATQIIAYVNAAKNGSLLQTDRQVAQVLDYEEVFPPGVIVVPDESIKTEDETENADLDAAIGADNAGNQPPPGEQPNPANGQPPPAPPAQPPPAQPDAAGVGKAKQIKKLSDSDLERARKIFNAVKELPIDEEE